MRVGWVLAMALLMSAPVAAAYVDATIPTGSHWPSIVNP